MRKHSSKKNSGADGEGSDPGGKQFEQLRNNYLSIFAKYEHRINELSLLKELIESVNAFALSDRELIYHTYLEILVRYKSLSGAVLYHAGVGQGKNGKCCARSFDPDIDYADLLGRTGVPGTIIDEKKVLLVPDLGRHDTLNMLEGAMLALPLVSGEKSIGALILFKNDGDGFLETDIDFFSIVRDHLINIIAFQRIYFEKIDEQRHISQLSRFFPRGAVEKILESRAVPGLGSERKNACVLFADLQGFTALSESLEPEQVVDLLNAFFSHMIPVVFQNYGTLDKLMGDCIMAVFGAPIDDRKACHHAVKTALEMFVEFSRFKMQKGGICQGLKMTMGINSGELITGFVGGRNHLDYTVIGDTVNAAQRLQSMADGNEILVSRSVVDGTKKALLEGMKNVRAVHDLGEMTLRGKRQPLRIYRVLPVIC